jgi:hypothetical protein
MVRDCQSDCLSPSWLAQFVITSSTTYNPNVHIAPMNSPIQSSHASKRIKIDVPHVQDKGKVATSPSSPSNDSSKSVSSGMHMKDDCSHVISEIQPQDSNQPRATSKKSKGDNSDKRKISSQSGKYDF